MNPNLLAEARPQPGCLPNYLDELKKRSTTATMSVVDIFEEMYKIVEAPSDAPSDAPQQYSAASPSYSPTSPPHYVPSPSYSPTSPPHYVPSSPSYGAKDSPLPTTVPGYTPHHPSSSSNNQEEEAEEDSSEKQPSFNQYGSHLSKSTEKD
jgi:hypothetical protein